MDGSGDLFPFINSSIIGIIIGVVTAVFELEIFKKIQRNFKFLQILIIRSFFYIFLITLVIASEIGEVKSQIVFSGETLVELQKLKKARAVFESNLIISESLIQWNVIPSIYSKKELGSISLNDHEQSLKVYAGSESNLEKIIVFDDRISLTHDGSIHFSEFLAYGNSIPDSVLDQKIRKIKNGDLATLIYTSGTTGVPKGVMLTHGNFNEAFRIHDLRLKVQEDDLSLAFLPLSHIFERAWSLYALHKGVKVTFLSNPKLISQTLREIQPTVMCSVPRLYQKAYHAIQAKINQASSIRKKLFKAALETGKSYNEHIRNGEKPSFLLSVKYKFFDTLIFRKIKSAFGGKLRLMPCAGAPLSGQITEFFHIIGMPVLIGYGLTETCATVSVFPETGYKFGTVGTLMPDIEVKIGPENEILVKGGTVMKGYYKKPEETGKVFEDGWFKTGDSGSVDAEGHMTITGRIKDLMKTSNGKYVAPQPLEALLTNDNYIENVVLVGDDKPYVTALLVPNFDALKDLAQSLNVKYHDLEDLIKTSSIIEFYEEKLDQLQKSLAGFEKIKKFTLLSQDFNMQQGELTPTLKVRRTVVLDRFSDIIDRMYSFQ